VWSWLRRVAQACQSLSTRALPHATPLACQPHISRARTCLSSEVCFSQLLSIPQRMVLSCHPDP
jgi:hypothetical protein